MEKLSPNSVPKTQTTFNYPREDAFTTKLFNRENLEKLQQFVKPTKPKKPQLLIPPKVKVPAPAAKIMARWFPYARRVLCDYDDVMRCHFANDFTGNHPCSYTDQPIKRKASLCKGVLMDYCMRRMESIDSIKDHGDRSHQTHRFVNGMAGPHNCIPALNKPQHLEVLIRSLCELVAYSKRPIPWATTPKDQPTKFIGMSPAEMVHVYVFKVPDHVCAYSDQVRISHLYAQEMLGSKVGTYMRKEKSAISCRTHFARHLPMQRAEYISFILSKREGLADWRPGLFLGLMPEEMKQDWLVVRRDAVENSDAE